MRYLAILLAGALSLLASARAQSAANLEASGLAASQDATNLSANLSASADASTLNAGGGARDARSKRAASAALLPQLAGNTMQRPHAKALSPAALSFGAPSGSALSGSGFGAPGSRLSTPASGAAHSASPHRSSSSPTPPKPGVRKPGYSGTTPPRSPGSSVPQP
jgi:hypothetical protein